MSYITTLPPDPSDLDVALHNLLQAGFEFSVVEDRPASSEDAAAA